MRKAAAIIGPFLLLLVAPTTAQKETHLVGTLRETGQRVSLVDGNELYGWCQSAQDALRTGADDSVRIQPGATKGEVIGAATCWGYIEGIADSMPAGEEFSPGPNVRISQYVDVVFAFLKTHPELRDKGAATLVQTALSESFHKQNPR